MEIQQSTLNRIAEWEEVKRQQQALAERELNLRNEILAELFTGDDIEGTETLELGQGYKLKAEKKVNYKLLTLDDAVNKTLDQIEKLGEVEKYIAEKLVKFEPKLVLREYRALPDNIKKIFDPLVVISPAQGTLTLIEPKDKK